MDCLKKKVLGLNFYKPKKKNYIIKSKFRNEISKKKNFIRKKELCSFFRTKNTKKNKNLSRNQFKKYKKKFNKI